MNFVKNQIRVNHRIRAPEVRVIASNGSQIGVMPTANAIRLASEQHLDLVEIAPDAKPPVCRIVDFGKFRYEQAKKNKHESKHSSKLKELKFHVNIGENDYAIKVRHAAEFLQKGMRVKLSIFFRGRELQHQEYGMQLIRRAIQDLAEYGHSDSEPRLLGKNLHVMLVPGKAKPKPTATEQASSHHHAHSAETPKGGFGNTIKIDLKTTK